MNRRQVIFFTFINSANTQNQPSIWLDILHKSVQLKFQTARNKVFGVSQQRASLMGLCVSLIIVIAIIVIVGSIWLAASISFLVGLFAQFFGVLAIKLWNQLKQFISG